MKRIEIRMARRWGMCFGVRDALALVRQASAEPLTVLGELVHNPKVHEALDRAGVHRQSLEAGGPAPTARVMITAHGASDTARRAWAGRGHEVLDATCPLVRSAHERLAALVARGFWPVVIGQPGHVEVRGLTGDWPQSTVVQGAEDFARIPEVGKIGVVSQTTQPWREVAALVAALRQARPQAEVEWSDTVCRPTKERQQALEELCTWADVLVVVGGRHSNNTRQLARRGRELGCRVHHIEGPDEVDPAWFEGVGRVGLTAGTSTLDETVEAVRQRLEAVAAEQPEARREAA